MQSVCVWKSGQRSLTWQACQNVSRQERKYRQQLLGGGAERQLYSAGIASLPR
jgi:hypothetical protein